VGPEDNGVAAVGDSVEGDHPFALPAWL